MVWCKLIYSNEHKNLTTNYFMFSMHIRNVSLCSNGQCQAGQPGHLGVSLTLWFYLLHPV